MHAPFSKKYLLKSNKGTSVVFFAIVLTVILGITALTLDIGVVVLEKSRLTHAVDAATLAGAQELVANSSNTRRVVEEYIYKNTGNLKDLSVLVDTSNRTVEVTAVKTVDYYFAKIFNKTMQDVSANAKAKVENIKSLKGARPLAIIQQTFVYGNLYTLKEGAGDALSGNYAAIALGGTGGSIYRDNILYGYNGTITVGDLIQTETGNISGTTETSINHLLRQCNHTPRCTYQYYNKNCATIIFIPIVNTLDVNGRKYVKVLGFGTFFLEGVTNRSGQADVIGRFITYSAQGETSNSVGDFGTYGIRLVK
ncbi:MAG: Tad domain-containing protein [Clostridia bacterium]|nr:Tad domain-containing protein [Clostridia bacterium]